MIAALLLSLVAQGRGADEPSAAQPPTARWELETSSAVVGEPLAATLVVRHAPGAVVALAPGWLDHDYSWLALGAPRRLPTGTAAETRLRVELASLEAGARELPSPELELELAGGAKAKVEWQPVSLEFGAALGAGEDGPRPPRDFRPVAPEERESGWLALTLGGLALLAAGLLAGWFLRARRQRPAPAPSATQRLAALRARDLDDAAVVRELFYELTALVRREIDQRDGAARSALTDDEWCAQVSARFDAERARELAELVAASRAVKYGAARPTQWAVEEQLARAQRVLDAVADSARSAA